MNGYAAALVTLGTLAASPVCAFTPPKGHEALMRQEAYKEQFEKFSATMSEAKERLAPDEFAALDQEADKQLASEAKAEMETSSSEAEAWAMAYTVRIGLIAQELIYDHLRKNPTGVQGYYKLKSDALDGFMTVREGDGANSYAVYAYAVQTGGAYNSGEVEGLGELVGNKISLDYGNDDPEATVELTFDGDTARVLTSKAFRRSGWLGNGVYLDGEYARERR